MSNVLNNDYIRTYLKNKIRVQKQVELCEIPSRRRETLKKRSIHVVCEYFEPFRNAAMGT